MGDTKLVRRMPAEWESHAATWIAWPHHESDWPEKFAAIPWVYAEIVRILSKHEEVRILCHDDSVGRVARHCLNQHGVPDKRYQLHIVPNNRSWLRDSAPTAIKTNQGEVQWIHWGFNGWAKYDNYALDADVPPAIEKLSGLKRIEAMRPQGSGISLSEDRVILEGGAIETDGEGTFLVTEECLLSPEQERNPGFSRKDYEEVFAQYLGARKTIWLGQGCVGDDTHGHIDDIARFVAPATIVLPLEENHDDPNHERTVDNLKRLQAATDAHGRKFSIIPLPMPRPVIFAEERLPASYANFYIANGVVLVSTFNDKSDWIALETLAKLFPNREVVGIHAVDLVLGLGTLHCLTQQQPA